MTYQHSQVCWGVASWFVFGLWVDDKIESMVQEKFTMPEWQDCTWRRNSCGKDSCRICGQIKKDRQERLARGEDPDSMEAALDYVKKSLEQTLQLVQRQASEMGIDLDQIEDIATDEPPEAEEFILWREVHNWVLEVHEIAQIAWEMENFQDPRYMESLKDLTWYARTLDVKIYRKLCNRWELERGEEYADADFDYTKYVLGTCTNILRDVLVTLDGVSVDPRPAFMLLFSQLADLKKKIVALNTPLTSQHS